MYLTTEMLTYTKWSHIAFRELSQIAHFYLKLWSVMELTLGEIDALIEW